MWQGLWWLHASVLPVSAVVVLVAIAGSPECWNSGKVIDRRDANTNKEGLGINFSRVSFVLVLEWYIA